MTNSEKAREYAAEKFKVNPESKKWNITTTYMERPAVQGVFGEEESGTQRRANRLLHI